MSINIVKDVVGLTIPKVIHVTYSDIGMVPEEVWKTLMQMGEGYDIRIYDDDRVTNYMLSDCGSYIYNIYMNIATINHKRDLFRYCILYNEGGVYLDLKTKPHIPLVDMIDHNTQCRLYTCLGIRPHINQCIIATYKGNPFLKNLINDFITKEGISICAVQHKKCTPKFNYFTDSFYKHIKRVLGYDPSPGVNYSVNNHSGTQRNMYVLYEERLDVCLDNESHEDGLWTIYGGGSDIAGCSGCQLFTTRYKDFPW